MTLRPGTEETDVRLLNRVEFGRRGWVWSLEGADLAVSLGFGQAQWILGPAEMHEMVRSCPVLIDPLPNSSLSCSLERN